MVTDNTFHNKEFSLAEEYNQQGLTLFGAEKYNEAMKYFKKAQESDPMFIDTYFNMGDLYATIEEYDNAEESFKKVLLISKNNAFALFNLGNISFLKNDFTKGIEYYNRAMSEGYDDAQMYYNLGLVYEELENYQMAIRNYSKAIIKDPLRPDFRLKKASIYIASKDYEEALQTLEELNVACPDIFEGYHLRFEIYCVQRKYEEAEKIIQQAIELFPEDISLIYDKIRLLNIKGEFDLALQIIEESEKMEDYELEARNLTFERAKIYAQKEDIDSTIMYLEKLKDYEEESLDYEGRYFLMNAYLSTQNYEKVLENVEKLMEDPDESSYSRAAIYYKPFSLRMLKRNDEAERLYKEALRIYRRITISEPGNIDAYLFRVLCHKDLKEYDKAMELLDYVLILNSNSSEAHAIKSTIYEEMGDIIKAKEELELAKQLNPILDMDVLKV